MTEVQEHLQKMAQPYHITLTKNAKGTYQWEISVHHETSESALVEVAGIDTKLRDMYGEKSE